MWDGVVAAGVALECGDGVAWVRVLSAGLSADRRSGGCDTTATPGDCVGNEAGLMASCCVGDIDMDGSSPTSVGACLENLFVVLLRF